MRDWRLVAAVGNATAGAGVLSKQNVGCNEREGAYKGTWVAGLMDGVGVGRDSDEEGVGGGCKHGA
jgi:hypothetical protein